MKLIAYNELIRNLPYMDQAFETKKANWLRECKQDKNFKKFCGQFFKEDAVKLSRKDCFDFTQREFTEALYAIIFWGYPRNMRGNIFSNILKSIEKITDELSVNRHLTDAEFKLLSNNLKRTGLGLSTLTKVLYFFRFKVDDNPCLILDSRIMDVLQSKAFFELKQLSKINEFNKVSNYATYLEIMQNIAKQNAYTPDQLEFFLFRFGKNLKASNE